MLEVGEVVLPALCVGVSAVLLVPHRLEIVRVIIYIVTFVMARDALTPVLWRFRTSLQEGIGWIRMSQDPLILSLLGVVCLLLSQLVGKVHNWLYPLGGNSVLIWRCQGVSWLRVIIYGIGGAAMVVFPFVVLGYLEIPVDDQAEVVPAGNLVPLLFFCMTGCGVEEILFRGYFQGCLQTMDELRQISCPRMRRIFLSGVFFSLMHCNLATGVTKEGGGVILFTLYEGVIVSFVREKTGLWAAILAHGLGLFLACSGAM